MLRFPNPDNNKWLNKYNQLIDDVESGKIVFSNDWENVIKEDYESQEDYRIARIRLGKTTLHHIIPKKINPDIQNDKNNHIHVPFKEHMDMHYWLWKYNPIYAKHLWFGCVFGRKHKLWDLPGGDTEYEELKKDLRK